jgi:hypothetical protein
MGTAYYPTQTVETINIGTTSLTNPLALLVVNGVVYPNGFRVNYDRGYRLFSPTIDANNNVAIVCVALAYGQDLGAYSLSGVEVLLIG